MPVRHLQKLVPLARKFSSRSLLVLQISSSIHRRVVSCDKGNLLTGVDRYRTERRELGKEVPEIDKAREEVSAKG